MSTHLKTKSEQNLNLANEITINGSEFASSVHCSYYSCVQLMLHILRSHFMKSDAEVEENHQQESGSTHVKLIKEIGEQIKISNFGDYRIFKNKINDLKGFRVIADYKNEQIEREKAVQALSFAQEVNGTLLRNFNI